MTHSAIYDIAKKQAQEHGIINVSVASICKEAGCSPDQFSLGRIVRTLAEEGYPVKPILKKSEPKKQEILSKLLKFSHANPYVIMTREEAAAYVGVSPSLISYYFHTVKDMRNAIIEEALRIKDLIVINQGVTMLDPIALSEENTK